jgi:septal ring factor EnvC (AmiA/AmiB activator)
MLEILDLEQALVATADTLTEAAERLHNGEGCAERDHRPPPGHPRPPMLAGGSTMTEAPQEQRQPAADIATAIGEVTAQAIEATSTGRTDDAAEVRAITEAMVRLLAGVPLRSEGQLTIKSLAEEAGLRRNKLTHKHTGLKDLFYALIRAQDHRPKIADQLQADNDRLRQKLADLRADHTRLKDHLARFARAPARGPVNPPVPAQVRATRDPARNGLQTQTFGRPVRLVAKPQQRRFP